MKKIFYTLLPAFVLGLGMPIAFASAATLYVNSGSVGADAGNCQTAPGCATLTYLESQMTASDTARIGAGSYVENDATLHAWYITKGGTYSFEGTSTVQGNASGTRAIYVSVPNVTIEGPVTIDGQTKNDTIDTNSGATGLTIRANAFGRPTLMGGVTSIVDIGPALGNIGWTFTNVNIILAGQRFLRRFINGVAMSGLTFSGSASANVFENISATGTVMNTLTDSTFGTLGIPLVMNSGSLFKVMPSFWTIGTTGHGNAFHLSGTGTSVFSANSAVASGMLNMADNTIVHVGTPGASIIDLSSGSWSLTLGGDLDPTHQYIGVTGNGYAQTLVKLVGQPAPFIQGNTFETLSTSTVDQVAVWNGSTAAGSLGSPSITHNIFKSHSFGGHVIAVGSEGATLGDNSYDGAEIAYNQIYGPLYYDKTLVNPTIHGILAGYLINAHITNNYLNGLGLGIGMKADGNMTYATGSIAYNLALNMGGGSMAAYQVKGVNGVPFYNNISYNDATMPQPSSCFEYEQNTAGQFATNGVMKNNICYALHATPMVWLAEIGDTTGFAADNNLYWSETGTTTFRVASTFYDFPGWRALGANYDAHSPTPADPKWASATSGCSYNGSTECDFHLLSGSPAYNSGVNVGFAADYANTTISMLPEIGAYEYIATTKDLTSFVIGSIAATGTIDNIAKTVTMNVPYGTSLNGLVPTITTNGRSINPASGVAHSFTGGIASSYVVTAEDGSTATYAVTIDVAAASTPIVSSGSIVIGGAGGGVRITAPIVATPYIATTTAASSTVGVVSRHIFMRSLFPGRSAPEVRDLQHYLNTHGFIVATKGFGALGQETTYFGPATRAALRRFQIAHALALFGTNATQQATGNFGPLTRALINTMQ